MKYVLPSLCFSLLSTLAFSAEPICKSTAGDFLSWKTSSTIFTYKYKDDYKNYTEIKRDLLSKYKALCDSGAKSIDLISTMHDECSRLASNKIQNETQATYISACEIATQVARAFQEGYEFSNQPSPSKETSSSVASSSSSSVTSSVGPASVIEEKEVAAPAMKLTKDVSTKANDFNEDKDLSKLDAEFGK